MDRYPFWTKHVLRAIGDALIDIGIIIKHVSSFFNE
jgi:hypothetical protein